MLEENTINQTRNKKSTSGPHLPGPYMFTLLLTWTAGCLDAISYMRFTVFPANMTGNTVLIFPGSVTKTESRVVLLIALSSLAMGMQSVNARHFGVAGIPTTYITGTITSTIIGITHWFRTKFMQNESKNEQTKQNQDKDRQQIGFQSGVWLVYVIAAALAAVAETRLPAVAVFLPLASSILVLLTAILYQLA